MGFVVDKVSEDSFYENLLLGVSKILDKTPCVSNVCLQRFVGARQVDIRNWEHTNGVILPEDLRAFYSSTNGFSYTYDFSYDYACAGDDSGNRLTRTGRIEVNPLENLARTFGYETKNSAYLEQIKPNEYNLVLSRESKVFELANICEQNGKVVLVYINSYSIPNIWLYNSPMSFSYLANDFTTYFRMCLAHLGIPCWQCGVGNPDGLPDWSREIFNIIAPGILNENRNLVEYHNVNGSKLCLDDVVNKIDPSIFVVPQTIVTSALEAESGPIVVPGALGGGKVNGRIGDSKKMKGVALKHHRNSLVGKNKKSVGSF